MEGERWVSFVLPFSALFRRFEVYLSELVFFLMFLIV